MGLLKRCDRERSWIARGIVGICSVAIVSILPAAFADEKPANPAWFVAYQGDTGKKDPYTPQYAASLLTNYMSRVLGSTIGIGALSNSTAKTTFLITDAAHAPADVAKRLDGLKRDAFVIQYPYQLDGRNVCLLVSRDAFGYDFAVYHFLTRYMDVHWVGPGEIGEVVPKNPDWKMPAQISDLQNPDFEMRFWNTRAFSCRQWLAGSMRMGFHHALGVIFSPEKYGDQPDIFPLVEGKRYVPPKDGAHTANFQPCTSNPKVIDIAVNHVLASLTNDPQRIAVSLSVNDGAGNYCTCEGCRAEDSKDAFANPSQRPRLSDRFFRFYNKVAERVVKVNPDAYIAVLGYGAMTGIPPEEVKIHPRIIVFQTGGLNDAWKDCGGATALYQYLYQDGYQMVRTYPHMLGEMIRKLKSLNGLGFYSEPYGSWAGGAPKFYVLSHLLWKADSDVDALMDEYCRLAFGTNAAPIMRAYFDKWEEIYQRQSKQQQMVPIHAWRKAYQFEHLTRDDVNKLDDALARAKAAEMMPEQRKRVEMYATYYQWIRLSMEQYLITKQFEDLAWIDAHREEDILARMADSAGLTDKFNRMWEEVIRKDDTGWLFSKWGDPDKLWTTFLASLRQDLDSMHQTAMDRLLRYFADRRVAATGRNEAIAYWQAQQKRLPALADAIAVVLREIDGKGNPNLLVNGGFEKGTPGNPPTLDGWEFYQTFGGVRDVPHEYTWKDGDRRDGGKAIAMHEGLYQEIRAKVRFEKGRYRYSYWYKTVNRETPLRLWFTREIPDDPKQKLVSFMVLDEPPTDGEWRYVTRVFDVTIPGDYYFQPTANNQTKGTSTWYDDIAIVKLQ